MTPEKITIQRIRDLQTAFRLASDSMIKLEAEINWSEVTLNEASDKINETIANLNSIAQ
jgi:hypothetical protein